MALTTCSECGTQISDKAAACPKCGAPRAGVVTTQQTAKRFKGAQLLGAAVMSAGMVALVAGAAGWGAGLMMAGLGIFLVARARAWWAHG